LREQIPEDCVVVSESGIRGPDDICRLSAAGVDAVLVGEHLMASPDIGQAVRELMSGVTGHRGDRRGPA
jgi:indole-3-glycerol phosphate synthase